MDAILGFGRVTGYEGRQHWRTRRTSDVGGTGQREVRLGVRNRVDLGSGSEKGGHSCGKRSTERVRMSRDESTVEEVPQKGVVG